MAENETAIIGGGPAGMIAAVFAGEGGRAAIFEKNPFFGKKLLITGKGRCNVTNNTSVSEFAENVFHGDKFILSALGAFTPRDTMDFFESAGVPLKTERGNRVFPVSDRASDIRDALAEKIAKNPRLRRENAAVRDVEYKNGFFYVTAGGKTEIFSRVVIATGGVSYPLTGSTGDGYAFAEKLGHKIVPPRPSLVPLVCDEKDCERMMGLSLKNCAVRFTAEGGKKTVYEDFGELLFTHFGVSGPVILSASTRLSFPGKYVLSIDLKPALTPEKLDRRILSDFEERKNKAFSNSLSALLPAKMIPVVVERSGIDPKKQVNDVTRSERLALGALLKDLRFTVTGTRPVSEAIITSGGVDLREINPKTMESKIVPGLYFAGEVIDCDAYTGGFNLQIAFCTGAAAGRAICARTK